MAKYKAEPFYGINVKGIKIKFNYFGEYETKDEKEISVLDGLCPTWVKKADEQPKPPEPKAEETESPQTDEEEEKTEDPESLEAEEKAEEDVVESAKSTPTKTVKPKGKAKAKPKSSAK